jgi:hypothetical protein
MKLEKMALLVCAAGLALAAAGCRTLIREDPAQFIRESKLSYNLQERYLLRQAELSHEPFYRH